MIHNRKLGSAVSLLIMTISLSASVVAQAQDTRPPVVDDEDFPPGLLATYSDQHRSVHRIDRDLAFDWGSVAPDERIAGDQFTAEWVGQLLVRQPGQYRFHAFVSGDVGLELDHRSLIAWPQQTRSEDRGERWVSSQSVELPIGELPIQVRFRKTRTNARVSLFWSSESFPLEPVPWYLLFRAEPDDRLVRMEQGRHDFAAFRCGRCHKSPHLDAPPPGPDLTHVAAGLTEPAILAKLKNPGQSNSASRMPHFQWRSGEAEAVAAYLIGNSKPTKLSSTKIEKPQQDAEAGELLFRSLGCVACHQLGTIGPDGAWGGPELTEIGRIRSLPWLLTWLDKPESLRPGQRMPKFELTKAERRQLAVYLSGQSSSSPAAAETDEQSADVGRGRVLIEELKCAACHTIPGIKIDDRAALAMDRITDLGQGCVSTKPSATARHPVFKNAQRESLSAFVTSHRKTHSETNEFERGRMLLEQKGCIACHERQGKRALVGTAGQLVQADERLRGQSQALLPPALDSIGDKLLDKALAAAVTAGNSPRRLDWLKVRMPKFQHESDDQRAVLKYFVGHDRIPDQAPDAIELREISSEQAQLSGYTLVSPRGLSCIACHSMGSYRPRNVAIGTRGSNLFGMGKRMRPEFFLRWTRSPIRIVPGMEMPSYTKPVAGVLDGHIETQLSAIWAACNDPNFTVPTNPAVVEQFFVVRPEESCRVVRDVFTTPDENGGGYTARSLAVGFGNGHTIVYDLDAAVVRQWSFGDMARQRTSGKSWYWDTAGIPVMTGWRPESEWALKLGDTGRIILPTPDEANRCRLKSYANDGLGLELDYEVRFEVDSQVVWLAVHETWQPIESPAGRSGIVREVRVQPPAEGTAILRGQRLKAGIGEPRILRRSADSETDGDGDLVLEKNGSQTVRVIYTAQLNRTHVDFKPRPSLAAETKPVTSVPGYTGERLQLPASIMPTAMAWDHQGALVFTSLKGHVYRALDQDGDGIEDTLQLIEEGLAAPFGIIADGDSLIVAHKPELLRLRDTDGDGRADEREVLASGWGYTDNYHDWTCGIVRDSQGRLYVGLGSDYAQKQRPRDRARWRGTVLRIDGDGQVEPVAWSLRYPVGLAIQDDEIFVTDNQGVQNTFNEINHVRPGHHYGVPSRYESRQDITPTLPAIQVPHPWTRSVNAIGFFDPDTAGPFAGQGFGCEYDTRYLIRFSLQRTGDTFQGAAYEFSDPAAGTVAANFMGPICNAVSPQGDILIGSIHDSGWLGGQNTGEIVRLRRTSELPNGIREIRADRTGFVVDFLQPVDGRAAADPASYTATAYTRNWGGAYATPDADRHRVEIKSVEVSADRTRVRLRTGPRKTGYVHELSVDGKVDPSGRLWPSTGHYSLNAIPQLEIPLQ